MAINQELQQRIQTISVINQAQEKNIEAIYQSNSWRLTSLLRIMSNLLRTNKFRQRASHTE